MKQEITTITSKEVNEYGHVYDVAGIWNDKPFQITMFCEYDGRDVDSETDGYNPLLEDWQFFDKLSQDQRFITLHNEGYARWEAL